MLSCNFIKLCKLKYLRLEADSMIHNTPIAHGTIEEVKSVVLDLLSSSCLEGWNQNGRTREFATTLQTRLGDIEFFDFTYNTRNIFYEHINHKILDNKPIDYLEFGVAAGQSMKLWLGINKCAQSRFFGFDSFEGLPEDWDENNLKGQFDQNGQIPSYTDDRLTFIKGWFQETVDDFSLNFTPENRLVLHMDAQLYSSTLYALMHLDRHIVDGTIIIFDEFTARICIDEFAALQDYCKACYKDYTYIAAHQDFMRVAIEMKKAR